MATEAQRKAAKKYRESEKGKAAAKRYRESQKGRETLNKAHANWRFKKKKEQAPDTDKVAHKKSGKRFTVVTKNKNAVTLVDENDNAKAVKLDTFKRYYE